MQTIWKNLDQYQLILVHKQYHQLQTAHTTNIFSRLDISLK